METQPTLRAEVPSNSSTTESPALSGEIGTARAPLLNSTKTVSSDPDFARSTASPTMELRGGRL